MSGWQDFAGLNRGYVLEQYDKYRKDPSSVDPETRALFETWTPPADDNLTGPALTVDASGVSVQKIVGGGEPCGLDPPVRPPCRATRSARQQAPWGSVAARRDTRRHRAGSPKSARQSGRRPAVRRCHHGARRDRVAQTDLLLDGRLRLRARLRARRARLASSRGRMRSLPRAGRSDRPDGAARPSDGGRGVRAIPAPYLPGQNAVLDRRGSTCWCRSSTR